VKSCSNNSPGATGGCRRRKRNSPRPKPKLPRCIVHTSVLRPNTYLPNSSLNSIICRTICARKRRSPPPSVRRCWTKNVALNASTGSAGPLRRACRAGNPDGVLGTTPHSLPPLWPTPANVGEEGSEQIDLVPANLICGRTACPKYACRFGKAGVNIAPRPPG